MFMSKRRRKLNIFKLLRFIFILLLVVGIILFGIKYLHKKDNVKEVNKKEEKEVVKEEVKKLSLVMVGDNLIHDKIYNYFRNGNSYDFKPMLE